MKKLSLKRLNLSVDNLLKKEQLKTVFGGYSGSADCDGSCRFYSDCGPGCACCDDGLSGPDGVCCK